MSARLTLQDLEQATKGRILSSSQQNFVGVGTDTRENLQGQVFVALKGENFDAHDYLQKAVESGAKALIVHREMPGLAELYPQVSCVLVDDTLTALQNLGHYWRKKIKAKVVAVSGSNGKTTTKEFALAIVQTKWKAKASPNSFNNHWGVPISILSVGPEDEVAILEMGMNHAGELTRLTKIAEPDISLVTMVGQAHIGELGSQQAIAHAKEELYIAQPHAIQIFNLDNSFTMDMHEKALVQNKAKSFLTFSAFNPRVNVSMRTHRMDLDGIEVVGEINGVRGEAKVAIFGRHNTTNLMAASCIGLALGMTPAEIWAALPHCKGHWGRNQLVKLQSGTRVLFDGYNANPESMAMLVKNLLELSPKGKKVAVIGEMLELGQNSSRLHEELAELIGRSDVDLVWYIGSQGAAFRAGLERSGFEKKSYFSNTYEQTLANEIGSVLNPDDIVVIKGSRGMRLERVLEAWNPINF